MKFIHSLEIRKPNGMNGFLKTIFLEQFEVHNKIERKSQFPIISCPYTRIASLSLFIIDQNGTKCPICLLPLIGILDILYHFFFFHYLVKVLTSFYNILEIIRMLNETRTLHYKPMFSINDAVLSDNHIQFPWGATCTLCHNLKHCLHQPIFLSFYFIYFSATPVS